MKRTNIWYDELTMAGTFPQWNRRDWRSDQQIQNENCWNSQSIRNWVNESDRRRNGSNPLSTQIVWKSYVCPKKNILSAQLSKLVPKNSELQQSWEFRHKVNKNITRNCSFSLLDRTRRNGSHLPHRNASRANKTQRRLKLTYLILVSVIIFN